MTTLRTITYAPVELTDCEVVNVQIFMSGVDLKLQYVYYALDKDGKRHGDPETHTVDATPDATTIWDAGLGLVKGGEIAKGDVVEAAKR